MQKNILENFEKIKKEVCEIAIKAKENNWLSTEEYSHIEKRVKDDTLTIAVIGQMKAGKSTFLNAFLFQDEVLPAASTPMTASLSIITYGEKEEVEAEFYTKEEWDEMKKLASYAKSEKDAGNKLSADLQTALELYEKSDVLGNKIEQLLGTKQSSKLSELIEYVGADGKYISITKSVNIKYPMPKLKGVQVVDTPGFNDPVISREERTKKFLSNADVVIFVLYAGQAFTEEDRKIAFKYLKNAGVGKIVFAVNKYDMIEGQSEDAMKKYIKESILREVEKNKEDILLARMFGEPNPILLSAQAALYSTFSIDKIENDENHNFYYERLLDIFGIKTSKELFEKSKIANLETEINRVLSDEKMEILCRKPIGQIQSKITEKKLQYDQEELLLISEMRSLILSPEELMKQKGELVKSKEAITNKILEEKTKLQVFFKEEITTKENELLECKRHYINRMRNIPEVHSGKKCYEVLEDIQKELELDSIDILKNLTNIVKINFKQQSKEICNKLKENLGNYQEIENSINQKLQDLDNLSYEDIVRGNNIFQDLSYNEEKNSSMFGNVKNFVVNVTSLIPHPVAGIISNFLENTGDFLGTLFNSGRWAIGGKEKLLRTIDSIPMDIKEYDRILGNVLLCGDNFILFFEENILQRVIEAQLKNIERIQKEEAAEKEIQRAKIEGQLQELHKQKEQVEKEEQTIKDMVKELLGN